MPGGPRARGGVHSEQCGHESILPRLIGFVERRVVAREVFRQVDEGMASELGGVDQRRHFDDRCEWQALVGEVGDVVTGQGLLEQE